MPRGAFHHKPIPKEQQYTAVNDEKLRMTLIALSDRYNVKIRHMIYRAYQDDELAALWRAKRNSGVYDKGGKSKVHRKILEFPNAHVYDFVDTAMTTLYGPDWLRNRKALRHTLVRPWWVVSKL